MSRLDNPEKDEEENGKCVPQGMREGQHVRNRAQQRGSWPVIWLGAPGSPPARLSVGSWSAFRSLFRPNFTARAYRIPADGQPESRPDGRSDDPPRHR